MTIAQTKTATLIGVDAEIVDVEADVSIGLSNFNVVGLPDNAIKESRDRIQSALKSIPDGFPIRKVVVNLAPASLKKEGTGFDLPIAMAILEANGKVPKRSLQPYLIIGELSLNGRIRGVQGVLAVALSAKSAGIQKLLISPDNAEEAALVQGIEIWTPKNIVEAVHIVNQSKLFSPYLPEIKPQSLDKKSIVNQLDFAEVCGQRLAKRALEISSAGMHNILFSGPPGSGKSMLAKRFPSILPPLSFQDALETTKIHSIAGVLPKHSALLEDRPFREVHHSTSGAGLIGGGRPAKPGEVSLAHHGVLFLDEFPEFPRNTLDLMRQPLENKFVKISRAQQSIQFPANFLLLAAMNPCPCGFLGDQKKKCSCSAMQIQRYRAKISGPLLDRIDLQVEMPRISYEELNSEVKEEASEVIRKRILDVREVQKKRFEESTTQYNGEMNRKELKAYCSLTQEGHQFFSDALNKMNFSGRAHDRILKVARTIADLDSSKNIQVQHLAEAINYRCLDREIQF